MKSKIQVELSKCNLPMRILRAKKGHRRCISRSDDLRCGIIESRLAKMERSWMKYRRKKKRDDILINSWNFILGGSAGASMDKHLWFKPRVRGMGPTSTSLDLRRLVRRMRF